MKIEKKSLNASLLSMKKFSKGWRLGNVTRTSECGEIQKS